MTPSRHFFQRVLYTSGSKITVKNVVINIKNISGTLLGFTQVFQQQQDSLIICSSKKILILHQPDETDPLQIFKYSSKVCSRYLDEDNSGNIGFTEWALADYLIVRATPAEKLGWAFRT